MRLMEQIAQVHSEGKDRGQQPVLLENWKVRCMPEEAGAERLVEEEEVSEVPEVPEGGAGGGQYAMGIAGSANTGGGGGGGGYTRNDTSYAGGNGGSGIVLIRLY